MKNILILSMVLVFVAPAVGFGFSEGDHLFVTSEDGKAWYFDPLSLEILEGDILSIYVSVHYPAMDLMERRLWLFDSERGSFKELDSYTYTLDGSLVDQ